MEIKEAIKILHPDTTAEALYEYEREEAIKVVKESCVVACEALEKQIPKKLEVWADGTEHCPNCEHDNSCLGFKVCVKCGQAIDWEVE